MKKRWMALAVLVFVAFGFGLWGCGAVTEDGQESAGANAGEELVAHTEEVSLYAQKEGDVYRQFHMISGSSAQTYDWVSIVKEGYEPQIFQENLTGKNSGGGDLVVMTVEAVGTEVYVQQLHVIDPLSLEEYPVAAVVDVAADELVNTADEEQFTVGYGDDSYHIRKEETGIAEENFSVETWFGNLHHYEIIGDKLIGHARGQISPAMFWIEVVVEYQFEDGAFVPADISLIPLSNVPGIE